MHGMDRMIKDLNIDIYIYIYISFKMATYEIEFALNENQIRLFCVGF